MTADEALADEGEVSVKLPDGTTRPASIAGRDHTTDIALLRFDAKEIAPVKLSAVVPDLGSLSVVVAAEHGIPTAALGTVSLVGDRWRSLRGGEIDARIELDVRLRHSHQGGLALNASGEAIGMAVQGVRRVLVIPARRSTGSREDSRPMAGSRGAISGSGCSPSSSTMASARWS